MYSNFTIVFCLDFQSIFTWKDTDEALIGRYYKKRAGEWLKKTIARARKDDKRPDWIKTEIWDQLKQKWDDPKYKEIREKYQKNRKSESESGSAVYHGGSIPMSEHKARMVSKDNLI